MSTQTTLEPCPFCGSEETWIGVAGGPDSRGYTAYCPTCDVRGPGRLTSDEARDAWNRRTQTTDTLTREEIERVITDIIGTMRVTIERYGSPSGDPSEVYGWIYDSEDEHPQRSTPDTLFDPEAEGWAMVGDNGHVEVWESGPWKEPSYQWCRVHRCGTFELMTGVAATLSGDPDYTGGGHCYRGAHPTTALVHEIIRLNGGDSE